MALAIAGVENIISPSKPPSTPTMKKAIMQNMKVSKTTKGIWNREKLFKKSKRSFWNLIMFFFQK